MRDLCKIWLGDGIQSHGPLFIWDIFCNPRLLKMLKTAWDCKTACIFKIPSSPTFNVINPRSELGNSDFWMHLFSFHNLRLQAWKLSVWNYSTANTRYSVPGFLNFSNQLATWVDIHLAMSPSYHCEISKLSGLFSKTQLNKKWSQVIQNIWTWKELGFITPMVKEVEEQRHLNNWKCFILLKRYLSC